MALLLVNSDGTSSAQAGDLVVTGGGIFEKLADGTSVKVSDLPGGNTGSYDTVKSVFNKLTNDMLGFSQMTELQTSVQEKIEAEQQKPDENGIVYLGFDPSQYMNYSSNGSTSDSGTSSTFSNVVGWAVVGLIGIALLDRFINKSEK